jgi:hypothetical protein
MGISDVCLHLDLSAEQQNYEGRAYERFSLCQFILVPHHEWYVVSPIA